MDIELSLARGIIQMKVNVTIVKNRINVLSLYWDTVMNLHAYRALNKLLQTFAGKWAIENLFL